jgi:hypothetical protein
MNLLHKHTYKRLAALLGVLLALAIPSVPTIVLAAEAGDPAPTCAVKNFGPTPCPVGVGVGSSDCFIRDASLTDTTQVSDWKPIGCDDPAMKAPSAVNCTQEAKDVQYCDKAIVCASGGDEANCDLVKKYINPMIKALAALVGLGVTASIIWAGIQYGTSADDPGKVTAAKQRILVSVLTLLGFFVFFAFLNWIVPGGVV